MYRCNLLFWSRVPARQAESPTRRPAERSVPFVIRQPDTPTAMMKRHATLMEMLHKVAAAEEVLFCYTNKENHQQDQNNDTVIDQYIF